MHWNVYNEIFLFHILSTHKRELNEDTQTAVWFFIPNSNCVYVTHIFTYLFQFILFYFLLRVYFFFYKCLRHVCPCVFNFRFVFWMFLKVVDSLRSVCCPLYTVSGAFKIKYSNCVIVLATRYVLYVNVRHRMNLFRFCSQSIK